MQICYVTTIYGNIPLYLRTTRIMGLETVNLYLRGEDDPLGQAGLRVRIGITQDNGG